jgi:hypothetical protein
VLQEQPTGEPTNRRTSHMLEQEHESGAQHELNPNFTRTYNANEKQKNSNDTYTKGSKRRM